MSKEPAFFYFIVVEIFRHDWSSDRFCTTGNKGNTEIHTQRTSWETWFYV